jgi:amidase
MESHDLAELTAAETALLIRQRKLSPVEAVEAAITRIEARNPSLNAFVYLGFDDARAAAKVAEDKVMTGEPLGVLHGVPGAIKDLFDFKPGWPATFGGIRALEHMVRPIHCAFAERVENAGAILVGKTNSPIMGFRGTCDNYLFGPTRNPFDLTRNSGGSSGGSAAAVADGMVPFAEGSDGGGSIRIPAAWCGVYGYKPSHGRVPSFSRPNAFGSQTPFLFEGPIARTVEDAATVMQAIGGHDPRDPLSIDGEVDYLGALRRSIRGWKIAYSPDFDVFPVDPAVTQVIEEALGAFCDAGAVVEPVELGIRRSQRELSDLWCRLIMPLNIQDLESLAALGFDLLGQHRDDLPPEYLDWIDRSYDMRARDLYRDQAVRTEVYDAVQGVLGRYDLLVTPTLACLPVENAADGNTLGPAEVNGEAVDPLIGWCLTYPLNFTGHPAASIPAGLAAGNLPVGLQIVGRRHADADVLSASAAFERVRPWRAIYELTRCRPL